MIGYSEEVSFVFGMGGGSREVKVEKMEVSEDQRTTNVLLVEYMKGENR